MSNEAVNIQTLEDAWRARFGQKAVYPPSLTDTFWVHAFNELRVTKRLEEHGRPAWFPGLVGFMHSYRLKDPQ